MQNDKVKYEKVVNHLKIHDRSFPQCATRKQYRLWRGAGLKAGTAGFCEDCTPEFQKLRASEGRCEHPEVLFYVDNDGFVYGSFTVSEVKQAV